MENSIRCFLASVSVALLVLIVLVALGALAIGIPPETANGWRASLGRPAFQLQVGGILSLVGLVISLGVGYLFLSSLYEYFYGDNTTDGKRGALGFTVAEADEELEKLKNAKDESGQVKAVGEIGLVPARLFGVVERLFFTVAVAVHPGIGFASMFGWIAAKMLTNLNRAGTPTTRTQRSRALAGLLMSLSSMFFALLGGLMLFFGTRLIGMSLGFVSTD